MRTQAGIPMARALTPDQCMRMRSFLWALRAAANQCYEAGRAPDIGAAMRGWADRTERARWH